MSIRVVYSSQPNFPATDQHPNAARYFVDPYWVDAIGAPAPTLVDVQAFLNPKSNFLPYDVFVSRFTDAEYKAVKDGINTQIAAGNVKAIKFLDAVQARGGFDVTSPQATQIATALVTASILTAPRAAIIFAGV